MLQYLTCGESHGKYLMAILEGMPSGLKLDSSYINDELLRRQRGYGRGERMSIEEDHVEIISGCLKGETTGAPIGLLLENKNFTIDSLPPLFRPRPGHADLAGALKYREEIRSILERASARETAMRVATGAVAKRLVSEFGAGLVSHVVQIGHVSVPKKPLSFDEIGEKVKTSILNCAFPQAERDMIHAIDLARKRKDTLGGTFEVIVRGVPPGLGSHVHYLRKLDGRIAQSLMSVQAIKAVEFGLGRDYAETPGHLAHDEIFYNRTRGYFRKSNRAGGIEGGMSNGADIVVRATMKPIATLGKPLRSVDVRTKRPMLADFERADICAVPAASVIGEAACAFEIARAMCEKFGGDSLSEMKRNFRGYLAQLRHS
ncbi:MAG: chorismate synthase [Candidatus Omnitrophica bacterium]|nr:chorismate synthase [Candidatus Omnitrophota bacterium]